MLSLYLTTMNFSIKYRVIYIFLQILIFSNIVVSQCDQQSEEILSPRLANYVIKADLDRISHKATCTQTVTWTNSSDQPVSELRFYMYMNAFKTPNSTYLKGSTHFFGEDIRSRKKSEYGYISITKIKSNSDDLGNNIKYIQPNDGNENDETVLAVSLVEPIPAGEQITLEMDFISKLPRTFVRAGYGKNDFHLFVHWFPQLGVYERDQNGKWAWNCHQFMQKTEFYADFGIYDVTITTDDDFIIGASGCRISESTSEGKKTSRFVAEDVIDFGWTAYPYFKTYTDQCNNIDIELLIPTEHEGMAAKYIDVIKKSIDYLEAYLGPYHYPKITIVDPPVHSMRSGFMEYPMMITVASVYGTPDRFRGSQSLAIHEFSHMYFMGMLASNEKEEAWLDEGFVTFYEDEILDHIYGENCSFYDFGLIKTGNAQKSRQEYTTLNNPEFEIIAKPGWENKGYYKELVYGKTATVIRTFKNIIGNDAFNDLMRSYFANNKFTHPKEADWLKAVDESMSGHPISSSFDAKKYWYQALHTSKYIDFAIKDIDTTNHTVTIENKGAFEIPTEVKITFTNNSHQTILWNGKGIKTYKYNSNLQIKEVFIDPNKKILLDLNYTNNSFTYSPDDKASLKYGHLTTLGGQLLFHVLSFLL